MFSFVGISPLVAKTYTTSSVLAWLLEQVYLDWVLIITDAISVWQLIVMYGETNNHWNPNEESTSLSAEIGYFIMHLTVNAGFEIFFLFFKPTIEPECPVGTICEPIVCEYWDDECIERQAA